VGSKWTIAYHFLKQASLSFLSEHIMNNLITLLHIIDGGNDLSVGSEERYITVRLKTAAPQPQHSQSLATGDD
jgi:hypothetical protein